LRALGYLPSSISELTKGARGGSVTQRPAMTIEIKRPEIEAMIQQRLHGGGFESVEDVLFDALEIQREREAWLQENKEAIGAKIDRGLAQLERGEGIPGDELRVRQAADRAKHLKNRSDR
jgi:antitoxin ParD1/3/4